MMPIDMTKVSLDKLEPDELAVFKWQYDLNGDFYSALFNAIKLADDTNLNNLIKGFPIEVEGFNKYRLVPMWWSEVKRKAVKGS